MSTLVPASARPRRLFVQHKKFELVEPWEQWWRPRPQQCCIREPREYPGTARCAARPHGGASPPKSRPGRMRSCLSTGSAPVGLCVRIRHAAYKIQDTTLASALARTRAASSSACRCDLHEPLRPAGPAQQGMGRMGRGRPGTTRSRSACCPISCGCSARPMWTCFSRRRKGLFVKAPLLIHQNRRRRAWARAASHAWPRGQSARICGDASV